MGEKRFFASCALGAEDRLKGEIESFHPFCLDLEGRPTTVGLQFIDVTPGGVEFETSLEAGFALNHWLKTANRIWLRLESFPAKSPQRMQDRLRNLNFKLTFKSIAQKKKGN